MVAKDVLTIMLDFIIVTIINKGAYILRFVVLFFPPWKMIIWAVVTMDKFHHYMVRFFYLTPVH